MKFFRVLVFMFLAATVVVLSCGNAIGQTKKRQSESKIVTDMDTDLSSYPEYYRKRVLAFREIMRSGKTKKSKIQKAVKMLRNEDSPYRKEALQFLGEVRAKEATRAIIEVGEDKDLRSDAAFALGEIRNKKGIDFLLRCLYDSNRNVRGNAVMALRKVTKIQFGYDYSASEKERNKAAGHWEAWWTDNKKTFKIRDITEEERREAEMKWQKYGKKYIEREESP